MNGRGDREAMLDMVAAYSLGVLPPAEHRLVAALLLHDDDARAEFAALRPVADAVGLAAEEPVDSARAARMKQRLMATVRAQAATPQRAAAGPRVAGLWASGLAAAAAVVFALVSTIQNFSLRSDLANANRRAGALQAQLATNERVRSRDRQMVADLVAADAQRFAVPGGDVVRHGDRVYLVMKKLPGLPRGKVYQAWTLAKGAKSVAPSVTFVPNTGGVAVVALPENAQSLSAVAVSVEPEGGSKAPTSKPNFVRPLS
ncbi:MAG: anti-sigma factor domain-containing protein [Candidatus Velthaea sp.]